MMIHKVKRIGGEVDTLAGEFLILKDGCLLNYEGEGTNSLTRIIANGQWIEVTSQLVAPMQGGSNEREKLN